MRRANGASCQPTSDTAISSEKYTSSSHHEDIDSSLDSEEEEVNRLRSEREQRDQRGRKSNFQCAGCGGNHPRSECRFLDAICRSCEKRGHIAKVCRNKRGSSPKRKENNFRQAAGTPPTNRDRLNNQWSQYNRNRMFTGCVLWGDRVVIPEKLQKKVLNLLHDGYPGIIRMKALARSYAWWPGMDKQIKAWVATCSKCQETRSAPPKASPAEWETPRGPWSRIHIDFAGPTKGHTFLITVDAYSNWLEVNKMKITTTEAVIKKLNRLFATHGLPDVLVSDNGPQFTALAFEQYLKVTRMLFLQHITPNSTTNKSPAELLMGRKLRLHLDHLHPAYTPEKPLGSSSKHRTFKVGDPVFAKNFSGDPLWIPAKITQITGPRSYRLETTDGRLWKRHIDQLRSRLTTTPITSPDLEARGGRVLKLNQHLAQKT
ncbi:uncharacterized protein K02A2.6-like [Notechis scutatus]|uniref:Gypsy retrotransposon integrase-like protein 1 n=1 Tax=Notechis scutatus TaxID=8663 RepID=A0A6J1UBE5_9SAUR|nr:uncharacterized protein K02A2.6-like [Notechis scutatus]